MGRLTCSSVNIHTPSGVKVPNYSLMIGFSLLWETIQMPALFWELNKDTQSTQVTVLIGLVLAKQSRMPRGKATVFLWRAIRKLLTNSQFSQSDERFSTTIYPKNLQRQQNWILTSAEDNTHSPTCLLPRHSAPSAHMRPSVLILVETDFLFFCSY